MKFSKTHIIILSTLFFLFFACKKTETVCLEIQNTTSNIGFYYRTNTNTYIDTSFVNGNIILESTRGNVLVNFKNTANIAIPLSPINDTSIMYVQPDSTSSILDTVTTINSRKLHFISNSCGYSTYFDIKNITYTQHTIDTIIVQNNSVTNDKNVEHVKIVFH